MSLADPPQDEALPLIDPASVPDRDSLIRHLVNTCGFQTCRIARDFGLTSRRVRQITEQRPPLTPVNTPAPEPMTAEEKRDMLDEYERRATTPEGRMQLEVLRDWFNQ